MATFIDHSHAAFAPRAALFPSHAERTTQKGNQLQTFALVRLGHLQ